MLFPCSPQLQGSASAKKKTGPGIRKNGSAGVRANIGKLCRGTADGAQGAAIETHLTNIHRHQA